MGAVVTDSWSDTEEVRETLRDAVAREVMGWTALRIDWAYSGTTDVWHDASGLPVLTRYSWQPDYHDAQAMEVVDRMLALGYRFAMGAERGLAFAAFETGSAPTRIEHRDRRMAILRAALRAVRDPFRP